MEGSCPVGAPAERSWTPLPGVTRPAIMAAGFAAILAVGWFDWVTGPELGLSLFYLVPVAAGAWIGGGGAGIFLSATAAAIWWAADVETHPFTSHFYPVWNAAIRMGMFTTSALLLASLHRALRRLRELSVTDPLTGAANRRAFCERLTLEIARSRRSGEPLSLAFLDLDDFKGLNDRLGHGTGDRVLQHVVQVFQRNLRATDLVARLGGDEFAILLPETGDAAAKAVLSKLRTLLAGDLEISGWSVTFSLGVVTYAGGGEEPEDLMRRADEGMYGAKRAGKEGVVPEARREDAAMPAGEGSAG